jgi:hypothetical protein
MIDTKDSDQKVRTILAVPKGQHHNSTFFPAAVVPGLQANLCSGMRLGHVCHSGEIRKSFKPFCAACYCAV